MDIKIHELKTWPEYFQAVWDGRKSFEIRKNDRNFKVGDRVRLVEYDPETATRLSRGIVADIVYMTDFGQANGFVVLGLDRGINCSVTDLYPKGESGK